MKKLTKKFGAFLFVLALVTFAAAGVCTNTKTRSIVPTVGFGGGPIPICNPFNPNCDCSGCNNNDPAHCQCQGHSFLKPSPQPEQ